MFKLLKSRFRTQKKIKSTSLSPRTKSNRTKAATTLQTTFKNKEDCGICLSKMLNIKTQVRLVPCGHRFHRDCINKFVTSGGKRCPNCRTPFTSDDIVTPNQYKILEAHKHKQPHTLKKTLHLFNAAMNNCKEAYEKYQATIQPREVAAWDYNDYVSTNYPPPHSMNPLRYFYNKKEARLEKVWQDAAAAEWEAYDKYLLKCKVAAPFRAQSRKNFNPNDYREFNEYIQSIYESQNPNTLEKLTTHKYTKRPLKFD